MEIAEVEGKMVDEERGLQIGDQALEMGPEQKEGANRVEGFWAEGYRQRPLLGSELE
jgi:hypothetical protein